MGTKEAVEFNINAQDRASAKITQMMERIEAEVERAKVKKRKMEEEEKKFHAAKIERLRQLGAQTKASTEFAGTFAAQLGGTAFGEYASGIAMVTERISAFSEVAKGGGKAALLFKAGLLAMAGVMAFNLGKKLAQWTSGAEAAIATMKRANEAAAAAISAKTEELNKEFAQKQELAAAIGGEAELKWQKETRAVLEKQIVTVQRRIKMSEALIDAGQVDREEGEKAIAVMKERLNLQKQQYESISEQTLAHKARIEAINAAKDAEKKAIDDAAAAKKKADEDEKKRLEEKQKKMLDGFKKGMAAARKDVEDKKKAEKDLATKALAIKAKLEGAAGGGGGGAGALTATEGRLMSGRATAQDPQEKVVVNTEMILAEMAREKEQFTKMVASLKAIEKAGAVDFTELGS